MASSKRSTRTPDTGGRDKAATGAKAPAPTLVQTLDEIFAPANRSNAPGLVVGIAHRGRTLYRRGYGMSSLEHATANTPATRMRIASVTKQFTCLAVLLLAEEGRLDIDASIGSLIPELPELAGHPTLRQLMSHAGGLHDTADMIFMARGVSPVAAGEELRSAKRQTAVNFAPGKSQLYSNTGYALLSTAIERASGTSYERFMKERVFEPLGMHDSDSIPSDMTLVPGLATMHQAMPDGSWRRGMNPGEENQGAGAMVSTVDDLLAWLAQLRGPGRRIGSAETWRRLAEPAVLDNGYRTAYAMGLVRRHYRGVEVLEHGGSLIGVLSQLITVPGEELDIAILANCEVFNSVELSYRAIEAVLGEKALAAKTPIATSERFPHLFGVRYHGESGMTIGFDDVGGTLGFSLFHSPPIPMLEDHGEELRLGGAGIGPFVLKVADLAAVDGKAPRSLTLGDAGQPQRLLRLPVKAPAPAVAGGSLLGSYRVADLAATACVELEGEQLVLHIDTSQGRRSAVLEPLSDSVFGVLVRDPVFPARYVITVDRSGDGAPSFKLDGGRTRNVRFERLAD